MRKEPFPAIATRETPGSAKAIRNSLPRNLVFGAALTLFAGLASASENTNWDLDNDGYLDNDEFYDGASGQSLFPELDEDNNGLLDNSEFSKSPYDVSFDYWDKDENGWLDSGEFYDGQYDYYDDDEDGFWDGDDWNLAVEDGFLDW